jgi:peptide-methionine (R)-S-oxide reductase|tara:strand:+ start:78687 stop:79079 length:393 start_codon:yes stop_codon:yes gene_type:complete
MNDKPSDTKNQKTLSAEQHRVLNEKGTERAFASPLNDEKREGVYACAACGTQLFTSEHKYDSGSGWPSFYAPIEDSALGQTTDHDIGYARTEVHCAKCGGHMGHVFPDGPKPTGLRFCVNGASLEFKAKD